MKAVLKRLGPNLVVAAAFAPAVALGQAFGRQGCFAAGCCWGKPTDLFWGVHFTEAGHEYTGVPMYGPEGLDLYLHPTQLIESFTMLAVLLPAPLLFHPPFVLTIVVPFLRAIGAIP